MTNSLFTCILTIFHIHWFHFITYQLITHAFMLVWLLWACTYTVMYMCYVFMRGINVADYLSVKMISMCQIHIRKCGPAKSVTIKVFIGSFFSLPPVVQKPRAFKLLEADQPHMRNYLHKPPPLPDYRHTHNLLGLVKVIHCSELDHTYPKSENF